MGLDGVEFLMSLEEAFGIHVPDAAAFTLRTPRLVIDYIHVQLPQTGESAGICLPQRAFYRLRDILTSWLWIDRSAVRPASDLDDLLPAEGRTATWARIGDVFGARRWTRVGWWGSPTRTRVNTMREAATWIAANMPVAIKRPDEAWVRSEVAWVVDRMIRDRLGIYEYGLDDDFVRDLGVD